MAILHPVYRALRRPINAFVSDQKQCDAQVGMIARELFDAGMLKDAELSGGLVIVAGSRVN